MIRYNRKLNDMLELTPVTNFIKGQRIQWLGHIVRIRENEVVRVALEWKPHGKRPRKRWIDVVEETYKSLKLRIGERQPKIEISSEV